MRPEFKLSFFSIVSIVVPLGLVRYYKILRMPFEFLNNSGSVWSIKLSFCSYKLFNLQKLPFVAAAAKINCWYEAFKIQFWASNSVDRTDQKCVKTFRKIFKVFASFGHHSEEFQFRSLWLPWALSTALFSKADWMKSKSMNSRVKQNKTSIVSGWELFLLLTKKQVFQTSIAKTVVEKLRITDFRSRFSTDLPQAMATFFQRDISFMKPHFFLRFVHQIYMWKMFFVCLY